MRNFLCVAFHSKWLVKLFSKELLILLVLSSPITANELPKVRVIAAEVQELHDLYIYTVSLESRRQSEIHSEISGTVKEINVDIGQTVRVGDPLLQLQHMQPEYSYAPFIVNSPIDGTVAAIEKKIGSSVRQADMLIHIVNQKDLEIIFEIPEAELSLLKKEATGEIEFRVINNKIPVKIKGISPLVKPMSGTAVGKLAMREDQFTDELRNLIHSKLYPGMIGQAKFKLNSRMGIAIPKEAITFENQRYVVRTIINDKVIKKTITIGKEMDPFAEVTAGLTAGDLVVVGRSKYLKENELVEIDKGDPKNE